MFGLSTEMLIFILFFAVIIIVLIAKRDTKAIVALAASVPLFWLFSKKLSGSEKELENIKSDYDKKLEEAKQEFNLKLDALKNELQSELIKSQQVEQAAKQEVIETSLKTKEFIKKASKEELVELAKGLLAIPGKEN